MRPQKNHQNLIRRMFCALLGLLMIVQVGAGTLPVEQTTGDDSLRMVICTGAGMQTVTISLIDGSVERSSDPGDVKCPLCVIGAVDLVADFEPPVRASSFQRASCERAIAKLGPIRAVHRLNPIRAPPRFL